MASRLTRHGGGGPPYAWRGKKSRSSVARTSSATSEPPAACETWLTLRSWRNWLLDQLQQPQQWAGPRLPQEPLGAAALGQVLQLLVEREASRPGDQEAQRDADQHQVVLEPALHDVEALL